MRITRGVKLYDYENVSIPIKSHVNCFYSTGTKITFHKTDKISCNSAYI
jgi:hypothetical protein